MQQMMPLHVYKDNWNKYIMFKVAEKNINDKWKKRENN